MTYKPDKLRTADPTPPADLSDGARAEWMRLSYLIDEGSITDADLSAFGDYCRSYDRCRRLEIQIDQEGATVTDSKYGGVKANPALLQLSRERTNVHKLRDQLGLTPKARKGRAPAAPRKAEIDNPWEQQR